MYAESTQNPPGFLPTAAALPYTTRFLQEVLRMYQPNWILMRRALETVRIGDVQLPEGAEVIYSPSALHRDPGESLWPPCPLLRRRSWRGRRSPSCAVLTGPRCPLTRAAPIPPPRSRCITPPQCRRPQPPWVPGRNVHRTTLMLTLFQVRTISPLPSDVVPFSIVGEVTEGA